MARLYGWVGHCTSVLAEGTDGIVDMMYQFYSTPEKGSPTFEDLFNWKPTYKRVYYKFETEEMRLSLNLDGFICVYDSAQDGLESYVGHHTIVGPYAIIGLLDGEPCCFHSRLNVEALCLWHAGQQRYWHATFHEGEPTPVDSAPAQQSEAKPVERNRSGGSGPTLH